MHWRTIVLFIVAAVVGAAPAWSQSVAFNRITFAVPTADFSGVAEMVLADMNTDGFLDVVGTVPGGLSVHLNRGDGRMHDFILTVNIGQDFAVGDLNQDGKLDVVSTGNTHLRVSLGNGDGTFQPIQSYPTPFEPEAGVGSLRGVTAVADFNGDGLADVVTTERAAQRHWILIYPGNGDGSLGQPFYSGSSAFGPYVVVTADFNGDGATDLAASNQQCGAFALMLNPGGGMLGAPPECASFVRSRFFADELIVADLDGNGTADVAGRFSTRTVIDYVLVNGDGSWQPPQQIDAAPTCVADRCGLTSIAAADFNHDGRIDLAAASTRELTIVMASGPTQWEPLKIIHPTGFPVGARIAAGDLNRDGLADLAMALGDQLYVFLAMPEEPIVWMNLINATASGGSLQKTGGCSGCDDAFGASAQVIGSGLASVSVRVSGPGAWAVGLAVPRSIPTPTPLAGMRYALRFANGTAQVWENGVLRAQTAYVDGDEFRIVIESNTLVSYYRNGFSLFHFSQQPPIYPLRIFAVLTSVGATLHDGRIAMPAGVGAGR